MIITDFGRFYAQMSDFLKKSIELFIFQKELNGNMLFSWLKFIAVVVSIVFILGIIYSLFRLMRFQGRQLNELVKMLVEHSPEERISKWDKIKKYLDSENSIDWRWAILEADNIIEDIFKRIGYKGATLGERLLKVKPYRLQNLPSLFEAHMIRNKIIREGEKFELSKEKAKQVIGQYEEALKEMGYI